MIGKGRYHLGCAGPQDGIVSGRRVTLMEIDRLEMDHYLDVPERLVEAPRVRALKLGKESSVLWKQRRRTRSEARAFRQRCHSAKQVIVLVQKRLREGSYRGLA